MDITKTSQNPRTLNESFAVIEESCIEFDRKEIYDFLLDYSTKIAEIEQVDLEDSANNRFIEFVMRGTLSNYSDLILHVSLENTESLHLRYYPPEVKDVINLYLTNPLNTYIPEVYAHSKMRPQKHQCVL